MEGIKHQVPENFDRLHAEEEKLRTKALLIIEHDEGLKLHLNLIECAMGLAESLRVYGPDSDDMKVIRTLGMRCFNAFASSLKLLTTGYSQTSALILRDILETAFLLDLFQSYRHLIAEWRLADSKTQREKFGPVSVRKLLDERDGNGGKKRAELYKLFSELAGHPNMKSDYMLRPHKDGDALAGPFIEELTLRAGLGEMGKLAVQIAESLDQFFDFENEHVAAERHKFKKLKAEWIGCFLPRRKS